MSCSAPNNSVVDDDSSLNVDEGSEDEEDLQAEKLVRNGSNESISMDYDVCESNILSSLFAGIPISRVVSSPVANHAKHDEEHISPSDDQGSAVKKLKCVNVVRSKQTGSRHSSILMKTGLREPDEIRIIFKQRPLGIQIKPLNIHGYGAKISKITNATVFDQGVRENMIITGLNNKDLLGCTFDQITSIIQSSNPPITLRLKQYKHSSSNHLPTALASSSSSCLRSKHVPKYGPIRDRRPDVQPPAATMNDTKSVNSNSNNKRYMYQPKQYASISVPDQVMLASFCAENMPISTVLSSSSDEEDIACLDDKKATHPSHGQLDQKQSSDDREAEQDDNEEDEEEVQDEEEDDGGMSYVNWNNIRLGASVIKYGYVLDIGNSEEDETTFELAYDMLRRQGLNIYEIRAAIRLVREQPEQVPALESFKHFSVNQANRSMVMVNPKFMPQEWLKEQNLQIAHNYHPQYEQYSDVDADDDDEEENDRQYSPISNITENEQDEDEDDGDLSSDESFKDCGNQFVQNNAIETSPLVSSRVSSSSISTGPRVESLEREIRNIELRQADDFDAGEEDSASAPSDDDERTHVPKPSKLVATLRKPRKKQEARLEHEDADNYGSKLRLTLTPISSERDFTKTADFNNIHAIYEDDEEEGEGKEAACEYEYKPKKPIAGYIDFFDDNETSVSQSPSISRSIQPQQIFDIIGFRSPPLENLAALQTSDDEDSREDAEYMYDEDIDEEDDELTAEGDEPDDGHLRLLEQEDNELTTPDLNNKYEENIAFYQQQQYSGQAEVASTEQDAEEEQHIIDGIDVCTYQYADGADMMDEADCLPQLMLKYVPTPNISTNMSSDAEDAMSHNVSNHSSLISNESNAKMQTNLNAVHHWKKVASRKKKVGEEQETAHSHSHSHSKLEELKHSIASNVKSIFQRISSPKHANKQAVSHQNENHKDNDNDNAATVPIHQSVHFWSEITMD